MVDCVDIPVNGQIGVALLSCTFFEPLFAFFSKTSGGQPTSCPSSPSHLSPAATPAPLQRGACINESKCTTSCALKLINTAWSLSVPVKPIALPSQVVPLPTARWAAPSPRACKQRVCMRANSASRLCRYSRPSTARSGSSLTQAYIRDAPDNGNPLVRPSPLTPVVLSLETQSRVCPPPIPCIMLSAATAL